MRFVRLVAVLVAVVVVAGCGGAAPPPSDPVLQAYFDDIATQTVASLRDAAAAAAPGSPAAGYATYLRASSQAASDSGHPVAPGKQVAERTDGGYQFCQGSGSQKTCYEYTRIAKVGGKVSDFSVNKHPIAGRLALGSGRSVAFEGLNAHATFIAAYETTASDNLLVAVRIRSRAGAGLGAVVASYRAGQGSPVDSAQSYGPDTLAGRSAANYLFAFPKSPLGGTITLSTIGTRTGTTATATLAVR